MKKNWDLGLLYKNENDPRIEKDVKTIEQTYAQFEKKYRGKDFTASVSKLYTALKDYENLSKIGIPKPWWYFALKTKLNASNTKAEAAATQINQRLTTASNKVKFFTLAISSLKKSQQKEYLSSKLLQPYKYFLECIFIKSKYNLDEKEEQMINLLSQTSYTMWVDGQRKQLSGQTVEYKGENMPLSKATSIRSDLPKNERYELDAKIASVLKSNSAFAEAEINAIYNFKKVLDEKRGYKKPYSNTILNYENDEKTIEALVATVTKYFSVSKRFYELHAKLLGEKKLKMADRDVKIGEVSKKFDFNLSVNIVKNAFRKMHPKYEKMLDEFLEKGQIDVEAVKGKYSGAFCWGMGDLPTYVLLNHADNIRSVETLAHEMGHAIHTEYSKRQPPLYEHYTTSVAEVASTFFEQLVIDELTLHLTEEEKIILLHNKILGDISTIFRQIACFNFELELHNTIRAKGQVDKEEIATIMQKHMQAYVGNTIEVTKDDGYFFVAWPHIRTFFYVYSYAYGQIISRALYQKWKENPQYETKIEQFLSAGCSMSPKDIFKQAGIVTNEQLFQTALEAINADVSTLERLAKKQKRI